MHQRAETLRAFGALGLPLHLRLAFEEARGWSSASPVPPGSLADDVPGLIDQLIDRLRGEHGDALPAAALGYLAASRNGLSESEQLDLLSRDDAVGREIAVRFPLSPAAGGRVPPVLWARLLSDLEPYLSERQADGRVLMGFFHRQLFDRVRSRYLSNGFGSERHRELAVYFAAQPVLPDDAGESVPNLRKLSELPHHQAHAGMWDDLHATLTDLGFLEAKTRWVDTDTAVDDQGNIIEVHAGVYALQDDFDLALRVWPTGADSRRGTLAALARAVSRESHVLSARPELTRQQLTNRLRWSAASGKGLVDPDPGGQTWIRLRTRFAESDALLRRLDPSTDQLAACALSADGSLVVSTGMDRTVRVWDTASGRVVRVLRGADRAVACAVSRDRRHVVAAAGDGRLHAWRIENGEHVADVVAHDGPANACVITPDDRSVITFGADGLVRLWSLPELRHLQVLAEEPDHLTFGVLSSDGGTIGYGSRASGVVTLRDLADPASPRRRQHDFPVLCCAVGNPPDLLVGGGVDGRIAVWNGSDGGHREVQAHDGDVMECAFVGDTGLLCTGGDDAAVKIWRLSDLELVATLEGHAFNVTGCDASEDGSLVVSAGGDGTACLWDVEAARSARHAGHSGLVERCLFNPDGSALLTAGTDGWMRRWDVATGEEHANPVRHGGSTVQMAQSGEGIVLAAGDRGEVFLVTGGNASAEPLGAHDAQAWGLAVLADPPVAVTAGVDGTCRVWRLQGGGERFRFDGDGLPVRTCAVDPSSARIVSAGDGGIVHVWDPSNGSSISLLGHHAPVWSLAVAPGAVAAGAKDGAVRIWSPVTSGTGTLLGTHADSVEHLLWVESTLLVSGSVDGAVAMWNLDDGSVRRWQAHRGPVRGLALGPSRRVLVTAGADGDLSLWTLDDGTALAVIPFTGQLNDVAAHPVEPVIACVGQGGLVHLADVIDLPVPW
jgi:WD40 repeat protein